MYLRDNFKELGDGFLFFRNNCSKAKTALKLKQLSGRHKRDKKIASDSILYYNLLEVK
jgi:hypothetical protein